MAGLTQDLTQHSLVWLLSSTTVALVAGFVSSWLYYRYIKRREIVDTAAIHKEIEEYLGDRSAEREYRLEARKRLYQAVGPLRFQLLLASRDLASRVENHGLRQPYKLERGKYYFESTLFRILRPFAIAELIQRQVTYADFSVDEEIVDLIRFKTAVGQALTGDEFLLKHPGTDWEHQTEHPFSGTLNQAAFSLIVNDTGGQERVMHLAEFRDYVAAPGNLNKFSPLDSILDGFQIRSKPILWLRLVCLSHICTLFLNRFGPPIGLESKEPRLRELLAASHDQVILENITAYEEAIEHLMQQSWRTEGGTNV